MSLSPTWYSVQPVYLSTLTVELSPKADIQAHLTKISPTASYLLTTSSWVSPDSVRLCLWASVPISTKISFSESNSKAMLLTSLTLTSCSVPLSSLPAQSVLTRVSSKALASQVVLQELIPTLSRMEESVAENIQSNSTRF